MVNKAFAILDNNKSGEITVSDIIGIYDVSMNPEYIEGRKTKE
jgi:Ca2+-binding EF-hand superfamily protein